jgi:hypothetical protein
MGHHRPSRRSELDLNDLRVKTCCKRCGAVLVRSHHKWKAEEQLEAA